jgi:hypothetical protein
MESGQMGVWVVIDDQVYTLHVSVRPHGEITLDDDRNDPAILRDGGHVQIDMTTANRTAAGQLLQDTSHLLIGDLRILRPRLGSGGRQESVGAEEGTRGYQSRDGDSAGTKEGSAGCLRSGRHCTEISV